MERSVRWAARCRERLLALRDGGVAGRHRHQSGPGAVRHRPGRGLPGPPGRERRRHGGGRVRGLRDRRAQRGRAGRCHVRGHRAQTAARLPADQPRYLMGAGTPQDLVECVARGIDMFDCVMPTRNARNGQLFTSEGRVNIKNARLRRGRSAPRSPLRLLYLPAPFPGLSSPSVHGRRDDGGCP